MKYNNTTKFALSTGIFIIGFSQAHAAPIIQVYSDSLDVSYHVETVSNGVTTVNSDSANGSLLDGGTSVSFSQFYYNPGMDENFVIDANGSGLSTGTNSFTVDAEADDYPFSGSGSFTSIDNVPSVRGEASTTWKFGVLEENVDFSVLLMNEVYPVGTPPDTYEGSAAELVLVDLTTATTVLDVAGGFAQEYETVLLAGHKYELYAIAGDYGPSDEDVYVSFRFDPDAEIVRVPEPFTLSLLIAGLTGLSLRSRSHQH